MKSSIFKLNSRDFIKGLVVAIVTALLVALQEALGRHGLDFSAYDWSTILNVAVTAGVAYLGKNFMSDSEDKLLGRF